MPPMLDATFSRRRMFGLAAAAAAAVTVAGCGGSSSAKPAASASTGGLPALAGGRKVTIKTCVYAKNHASSMLYWQKFAPPGVTVSVVPVTDTSVILQGLEAGTLDFGLMSPYVPMLVQAKGGIHSKVVAMVARQGFGLIG